MTRNEQLAWAHKCGRLAAERGDPRRSCFIGAGPGGQNTEHEGTHIQGVEGLDVMWYKAYDEAIALQARKGDA